LKGIGAEVGARIIGALNRTFEVLKAAEDAPPRAGLRAPLNRTFEVLKVGTPAFSSVKLWPLNRTFEVLKVCKK